MSRSIQNLKPKVEQMMDKMENMAIHNKLEAQISLFPPQAKLQVPRWTQNESIWALYSSDLKE